MNKPLLIILHAVAIIIVALLFLFLQHNNIIISTQHSNRELLQNFSIEQYFCRNENCSEIIAETLGNATSIRCAFYTLKSDKIIRELANNNAKVVLGDSQSAGIMKKAFENAGNKAKISVRSTNSRGLMHDKFCTYSYSTGKEQNNMTITGSYNPKDYGALDNYDSIIITNAQGTYKQYTTEFNELYSKKFGGGKEESHITTTSLEKSNNSVSQFFCPDDNCSGHIIQHINNATSSIYVMEYVLTSKEIADSIIRAYERGVKVNIVLDKEFAYQSYSEGCRLKNSGIQVMVYKGNGIMHHKTIIIDNTTVIDGSMNPTGNGNEYNDENIIVMRIKGQAQAYADEFAGLWNNRNTTLLRGSSC